MTFDEVLELEPYPRLRAMIAHFPEKCWWNDVRSDVRPSVPVGPLPESLVTLDVAIAVVGCTEGGLCSAVRDGRVPSLLYKGRRRVYVEDVQRWHRETRTSRGW